MSGSEGLAAHLAAADQILDALARRVLGREVREVGHVHTLGHVHERRAPGAAADIFGVVMQLEQSRVGKTLLSETIRPPMLGCLSATITVKALTGFTSDIEAAIHQSCRGEDVYIVGGWRYTPDATDSDLSLSGWQLMSLHAAQQVGVEVPSGVIDGAEFVGPGSDIALGLYRVAPLYYGPGFNKPNGTGECIVSLKLWETLDSETRAIIAHATAVEANFALSEMERLNAEALVALTGQHRVQLRAFPGDVIAAARKQATEVLAELGGRSDKARRVHASYTAFHERTAPWSRISLRAVLEAREG